MQTSEARVTRKALAWAVGMTVALYVMLWIAAGSPTSGPAGQAEPVLALTSQPAGGN